MKVEARAFAHRARRGVRITSAFFLIGARTALNYPVSFVLSHLQPAFSVLTFFFVARFVDRSSPSVGGDYFTFVVLGILTGYVLAGGLTGFGSEVQTAVQQGRLEMILVEPVRWRLLPFGLVQWPVFSRLLGILPALALAFPLGLRIQVDGLWAAIAIVALGVIATVAIGTLSAGIGVLSKRSDPILALYTMAAPILAGALFPLDLLPGWIRWMSWLVPHTYVLAAMRKALMPVGGSIPGPAIGQALVGLALFSFAILPVAIWFFGRVMDFGRRYGLLAGY